MLRSSLDFKLLVVLSGLRKALAIALMVQLMQEDTGPPRVHNLQLFQDRQCGVCSTCIVPERQHTDRIFAVCRSTGWSS